MKKMIFFLFFAISCNPVFAQFFGSTPQSKLGTEYSTKTFNLNQNITDSLLLFVESGSRNILIDTASASGVTLQANIEQLSSANRWATNLGSWTVSGDMTATRQSDSSVTLNNIPVELNPSPNMTGTWTTLYQSDFSSTENLSETALISSANNDGISDGTKLYNDVYKGYADGTTSNHLAQGTMGQVSGDLCRFTGSVYLPSANTNANGALLGNSLNSTNIISGSSSIAKGAWTNFDLLIAYDNNYDTRFYETKDGIMSFTGANSSTNDIMYLYNIKMEKQVMPSGWVASAMTKNYYILVENSGVRFVSDGTNVYMSISGLTIGKSYKVVTTISEVISGGIKGQNGAWNSPHTTVGTFVDTFTAASTSFALGRYTGITNVKVSYLSITEIKDDGEFKLSRSTDVNKKYRLSVDAKSPSDITTELNPNPTFSNWSYTDILSGWDFTSGWMAAAATIIDNNSFSSAGGGVHKAIGLVSGETYVANYSVNTTSSYLNLRIGTSSPFQLVTSYLASNTQLIFTVNNGLSNNSCYFQNGTLGVTDFNYISMKKLIAPTGWTASTMNATNYIIQNTNGIQFIEGTGTTYIELSLTANKYYRFIGNIYSRTSGELNLAFNNQEFPFRTSTGLDTIDVFVDASKIRLQVDNNSNLILSNLSIKEYIPNNTKVYYSYGAFQDSTIGISPTSQNFTTEFWGQGLNTVKFTLSDTAKVNIKDISLEEITTKKVVKKGATTKVYFTPNTETVGNKTASITLNGNNTIDFNYNVVYSNNAYYVSNSGSDTNDGLSESTAWQTLDKIMEYDTSTGFNAGDKILFDANSVFNYPNFKLTSSGSSVAPIELNTYAGVHSNFNSGKLLTNYEVKATPSSIVRDTAQQDLGNVNKTSIAGEYYTGYKVTFTAGTLTKYFALSSETSPVKSQVKLYTSSDGVNFSVVANSESVVLESTVNGINTYNLKNPLEVTAGDYWIVIVANASRYVPYQTNTTGTNNYFFYNNSNAWNVGATEATFLSSISSPTLKHLPDVAIGAEIQTVTSGLSGTIYKAVVQNVKEVRLNGGQGVLGTLVNYADLDNENEYSIIDDSVFVFNDIENNVAIIKGYGLKINGDNYLIKNLYLKQNDSALVMNGDNIDIDSVYFLNNKYAFINNGENKIRQSKFVQNKTAVSNDSIDIYTNWFINSGLIGSSTLNFTAGNSKVIHNSFYTTLENGKAFIENSGGLFQLINNAFESSTNDYMIYTSEAIPEVNANAYAGNRTFYLNGTTYSSGTEWSAHNPENNIVLLESMNYTDLYNLDVSDNTTNVIDAGIETEIAYDIHGNEFPYDPTSLGYGNEDIGASEYQGAWNEGEVTPIPSGRVIYVRANGSNDYATYATNSITGVSIDALKSNINNEADGITVLFQKGNFFRTSDLYIHDINNITIGAYGSGAKPIIEIRDTLKGVKNSANWELYAPNVYRFRLINSGNSQISGVSRLWIDSQEYEASITSSIFPEANADLAIGSTYRWIYYPSSSSIMVWTPPGELPYDYYNSITVSSGNHLYGIRINNCDNVTIDGLQINASMQGAIWLGGTGSAPLTNSGIVTDVEIKNCNLWYGFQSALTVRGDGVDRVNIHHNIIDKKTDETFGGVRIHEMHHVVDLQWGCDDIEVYNNEIKGAGISSMRLIGANGSGYSENIKIHNNYIWSSSAWCRAFNVSVATGGTNNDRAKNVKIYNNYFENMRTRTQATAIDFEVYYNVFDSTIAYQDVKVLHHLGETSEGYEISDNDNGYWEFSDETSIQLNDLYYFNNTLFVSGREMFYGLRSNDGNDRTYICNNAFINAGKSTLVTTYSQDVILGSGRNYTIRNNYSWNDKRTNSQYAVKLGSSYYTWSGANAENFTYADFEANIQHGTGDVANYNLLFENPENNDFRVKSSSYMYQTGYMNSTLLNILGPNFHDQFGNQVTNSSGQLIKTLNIGAVNN